MTQNDILNQLDDSYTPVYPGTPLRVGSFGLDVGVMQVYLNAIRAQLYPSLTLLAVDGRFGNGTKQTVMQYQAIKKLKIDGIIGRATWDSIVADYASLPNPVVDVYPGVPITYGSSGPAVADMQTRLDAISLVYTAIQKVTIDGVFGQNTENATRLFQKQFGLTPDGIIGKLTWNLIINVQNNIKAGSPSKVITRYPGSPIGRGSSGDSVRFIQSYMNIVGQKNGFAFPTVTVDGLFGAATQQLVLAFQSKYGLKLDGIVGIDTWAKMISEFNKVI